MKKRILSVVLAILMVLMLIPSSVFAASGYVTVNGEKTKYSSIDEAVENAVAINNEVTYHIYGEVRATGNSTKYTPNMALNGAATTVNVIGETDDAMITFDGVYYQRISAAGAKLNVSKVTIDDDRKSSSEGDYDPWEFTYLQVDAKNVNFENCTFKEGIMVGIDANFKKCTFTMAPEYYKDLVGTANENTDYSTDHYALWIHNNGNITVDSCTFKDLTYGAIKSTWNMYGTSTEMNITVKNSIFDMDSTKTKKVPLNLDGATTVVFEGNYVYQDTANDNGSSVKSDIAIALTEKDTVVLCREHALEKTEKKDATCIEDGNIEYHKCSKCKVTFKDANASQIINENDVIISKTGKHTYKDGVCTVCGEKDPNYQATNLGGEGEKDGGKSPKTGDENNMILWISILALSAVGFGGTLFVSKKRI